MTAHTLGWQVPKHGAEGWLKAIFAFTLCSSYRRWAGKGKAAFDYLIEDQTSLMPAVAFREMGADLLKLADGKSDGSLSAFEKFLAEDIEEILLVRLPQLPSSRALG